MSAKKKMPWDWITELLHSSIRTPDERRVGIEIERIGLWSDGAGLHYKTVGDRPGAGELLALLEKAHHWPVIKSEKGCLLGFTSPFGKVSLEPGSQLELSVDAAADLVTVEKAAKEFERLVDTVSRPWGLTWTGIGVNPKNKVEEMDVIPSERYHIMTDYLGRRARLGTSMMRLTSSVQVNLDYTSEAEAIEMLRVALAAAPVSYALFANSPLLEGKETGHLSYRAAIWRETDPDRTGLLLRAFQPDFDFSTYGEFVWYRPLMFAQDREHHYLPAEGLALADIAAGKLPAAPLDEPNQINGIREVFTEARIKPGYIEVRSIDGLRHAERMAASAFWLGLLYSGEARRLALELLKPYIPNGLDALWSGASRDGLRTREAGVDMIGIARRLVTTAQTTLKARGFGEERYLEPLLGNIEAGESPADQLLKQWRGAWKGRMEELVAYCGQ